MGTSSLPPMTTVLIVSSRSIISLLIDNSHRQTITTEATRHNNNISHVVPLIQVISSNNMARHPWKEIKTCSRGVPHLLEVHPQVSSSTIKVRNLLLWRKLIVTIEAVLQTKVGTMQVSHQKGGNADLLIISLILWFLFSLQLNSMSRRRCSSSL